MRGCRSVMITHSNLDLCREFWYHLLNSSGKYQNWVEAGENFNNVVNVLKDLEQDPVRAERIANNAFSLFNHYLSEEALDCYIQEFFHLYAQVIAFEPALEEEDASIETYLLYPYKGNYPKDRLEKLGRYPQLFS